MFSLKRLTLPVFSLVTMVLLGACTIGQAPEPTPEALDVEAIYTNAAQTAIVQMTQIASLATPTLPPTATFTMTPTEMQAEDNTPLVQVTISVEITPLASPNPLIIGTATLMPGIATVTSMPVAGGTPEPECNSAAWEGETIEDGTKFKTGETFTKVWKLRNTGTCAWTDGYSFRLIDGDRMGAMDYYFVGKQNHIAPGDAVSLGITMRAPNSPGTYKGYWQLISDSKTNSMPFGWPVWVEIKVVN